MQSLSYAQSTVWGIPQSERQVGIMQEDRGFMFTYDTGSKTALYMRVRLMSHFFSKNSAWRATS